MLIACAVLLALSGWLAALDGTKRILVDQPFLATARNIALGPVNAWILAVHDGKVFSALPLLVPATLLPLASLGWWIVRRRLVWLAVAVVAWVAAGYWFAVAIWV